MQEMKISGRLSRRGLMKGATASAVALPLAGAVAPGSSSAAVNDASVFVTATVVRATHSRGTPGALRIGVRASILEAGAHGIERVLVIDAVPFGAAPSEIGQLIAQGVREQVSRILNRPDAPVRPEQVAVQVFGGAL